MTPILAEATPSPIVAAILQYVVVPGIAVVGPFLVAALAKLVTYLHSREKESKAALVAATFAEAAKSIVAELEVSMRPQLQKALADGHLTPEEGAQLKAEALKILKEKAPPALLAGASKLFGPMLDTWLGGLVERANVGLDAAKGNP